MTGYRLTPYNQIDDYGQEKVWKIQKQAQTLRKRKSQIAFYFFLNLYIKKGSLYFCWNPDSIGFNLVEYVLCHSTYSRRKGLVLFWFL